MSQLIKNILKAGLMLAGRGFGHSQRQGSRRILTKLPLGLSIMRGQPLPARLSFKILARLAHGSADDYTEQEWIQWPH